MDTIEYRAKRCNKCKTIYYPSVSFFNKNYSNCKKCRSIYAKQYRFKNKEKIKKRDYNYRIANKDKVKETKLKYYIKNKEKFYKKAIELRNENKIEYLAKQKRYYKKNKKKDLLNRKIKSSKDVSYLKLKTISIYDHIREHPNKKGIGQIKCRYCGKWTIPTFMEYQNRKQSINSFCGSSFIYCSTECKNACPTYGQRERSKTNKTATSREVDPLIRQMCFEYDGYTCQKCYKKENIELHCHHIQGAIKEPLLANDINNVITFCKKCHEQVHQEDGCSYNDYRRKRCA